MDRRGYKELSNALNPNPFGGEIKIHPEIREDQNVRYVKIYFNENLLFQLLNFMDEKGLMHHEGDEIIPNDTPSLKYLGHHTFEDTATK
jgi:hypothetical protein